MSEQEIHGGGGEERDFDTRDSYLVAALLTMGVEPVGSEPVRIIAREHESGSRYQFFFKAVSRCGKYRTRELLKWWMEGKRFVIANPDHEFAVCMAMALNLKDTISYIKGAVPYAFLYQGKGIAMLPMNASLGLEEKILGQFKK